VKCKWPLQAIDKVAEDRGEDEECQGLQSKVCPASDKAVECRREAVVGIVMGGAVAGVNLPSYPPDHGKNDPDEMPRPQILDRSPEKIGKRRNRHIRYG